MLGGGSDEGGAIRSYEKAGFSREGVLRSSRRLHGQLLDGCLMAILRPEWEALERPRGWQR